MVFLVENRSCIGVAIRNNRGFVMSSLVQQLPQAYQAIEIEAMATSRAMEFGREITVAKVIVEGDSAIMVKALCSSDTSLASYGLLTKDTTIYSSLFLELTYSYTTRESNRIAHSLAKQAVFFLYSMVWIYNVPPITSFVQADEATFDEFE